AESVGTANLIGGDGNDVFHFVGFTLSELDSVAGGGGDDLIQVDEGSASWLGGGIGGIETVEVLSNNASVNPSITSVFFDAAYGQQSIVVDGTALGAGEDLVVNATANDSTEAVDIRGGGGNDHLDGGQG